MCVCLFLYLISLTKKASLFFSFFVFFLSRLFRVSKREKRRVFLGIDSSRESFRPFRRRRHRERGGLSSSFERGLRSKDDFDDFDDFDDVVTSSSSNHRQNHPRRFLSAPLNTNVDHEHFDCATFMRRRKEGFNDDEEEEEED